MPLPSLNAEGDLPVGLHRASLDDVVAEFGKGTLQRVILRERLRRIHKLAKNTGQVKRFIVFGSFVTDRPEPQDIDVFLIVEDEFKVTEIQDEAKALFYHLRAQAQFGASVFWVRSTAALGGEEAVIGTWQLKRDGSRRGIVEVL
ncbi:MAG: nucleotidyltransferase domain-containing protein [Candidatus Binatia bacterium]